MYKNSNNSPLQKYDSLFEYILSKFEYHSKNAFFSKRGWTDIFGLFVAQNYSKNQINKVKVYFQTTEGASNAYMYTMLFRSCFILEGNIKTRT